MKNLVEITEKTHNVLIDIRYATSNNFTGKPVYKKPLCLLRPEAEEKLRIAIKIADSLNLKIKIFDAYRPAEAQYILWDHTPDPRFLADPEKGSPHSRGVAIDLTLVDKDGEELDMGTEFDKFTPLSHHAVIDGIPKTAIQNRLTLIGIMTSAGWDFYRNEWWHYQLFNSKTYPLIWNKDTDLDMVV